MAIKTDSETGLPALPDGYFWRVGSRRGEFGQENAVHLMYRNSRRSFFGSLVDRPYSVISRRLPETFDKVDVYDAAVNALRAWIRVKNSASMMGDYPPKKLGV